MGFELLKLTGMTYQPLYSQDEMDKLFDAFLGQKNIIINKTIDRIKNQINGRKLFIQNQQIDYTFYTKHNIDVYTMYFDLDFCILNYSIHENVFDRLTEIIDYIFLIYLPEKVNRNFDIISILRKRKIEKICQKI